MTEADAFLIENIALATAYGYSVEIDEENEVVTPVDEEPNEEPQKMDINVIMPDWSNKNKNTDPDNKGAETEAQRMLRLKWTFGSLLAGLILLIIALALFNRRKPAA